MPKSQGSPQAIIQTSARGEGTRLDDGLRAESSMAGLSYDEAVKILEVMKKDFNLVNISL